MIPRWRLPKNVSCHHPLLCMLMRKLHSRKLLKSIREPLLPSLHFSSGLLSGEPPRALFGTLSTSPPSKSISKNTLLPSSSLEPKRNLSSKKQSSSNEEEKPFDRNLKLKQRTRAATLHRWHNQRQKAADQQAISAHSYDYFHREVAHRLVERLDDICIREEGFPLALEIGAGAGFVHDAICDVDDELDAAPFADGEESLNDQAAFVGGRGGIRKLVQLDSCHAMLHRDNSDSNTNDSNGGNQRKDKEAICETYKLVANEENPFPFPEDTFDLVISSMSFHWINNLPKLLSEIKRVLKPDGCLLFALPGGNTLPELRSSLVLAELERTGGVSTHVGPYIDIANIGSLLTSTGFKLPTIDVDEIQIGYPNGMVLMEHLSRMGEGNACASRKERVGLDVFVAMNCIYQELYPSNEHDVQNELGRQDKSQDDSNGVVASAQIIYGIAWKEHESQQKPLERGSATHKMTNISVIQTSGK